MELPIVTHLLQTFILPIMCTKSQIQIGNSGRNPGVSGLGHEGYSLGMVGHIYLH